MFGFGGVRDYDGQLSLDPRLPEPWESLEFSLRFRGRQVHVRLTHDGEELWLSHGPPLDVTLRGEPRRLEHRKAADVAASVTGDTRLPNGVPRPA